MKKFVVFAVSLLTILNIFAIPAKKGITREVTINGKTQTVILCGDEHAHWWQTESGLKVNISDAGRAEVMTDVQFRNLVDHRTSRLAKINIKRAARLSNSPDKTVGTFHNYVGSKKGLIILTNFANLSMDSVNTQEEFNAMFNEEGYNKNNHIGSLHDYFHDQSYGLFDLTFDVVGPVTVSKSYSYYGKNNLYDNDSNPDKLVIEACNLVDSLVNFADYDWDGDGEVDQVYIVYAGYGEHATRQSNLIWPHEWDLESAGSSKLYLDSVYINTYAMSCELEGDYGNNLSGIGTACHEFSHCLGLPDIYDTDYSGAFGMDSWDLMDYGSYNGPSESGEIPSGYTSYERMVAGWLDPVEVHIGDTITSMKALQDTAEAYIVYNDAHNNEYYLLENRQPRGWFSYNLGYKGAQDGMLITHVDYSKTVWAQNAVNDNASHQRMSPFRADNSSSSSVGSAASYHKHLYPYNANDSLTDNSRPAAKLFSSNSDGRKFMHKPLRNITRNGDGTMSFVCNYAPVEAVEDSDSIQTPDSAYVFYESFDKCPGTGGNDGLWNAGAASLSADFVPDNEGWQAEKAFGGDRCAKFGTGSVIGEVTTPTFNLNGKGILTFKAAKWDLAKDGAVLTVYVNDDDVADVEMGTGEWKTFSIDIKGTGETTVSFVPSLRFFLDEVMVVSNDSTQQGADGINEVSTSYRRPTTNTIIYTITGQKAGKALSDLPRGIYVIDGRKTIKR